LFSGYNKGTKSQALPELKSRKELWDKREVSFPRCPTIIPTKTSISLAKMDYYIGLSNKERK
jgi:hypothetical protein